ncbi:MAG: hypothetical protein MR018_04215 [Clostridiales bacterium]|nr:hypothetical protein [Clostridiales bacterium]MDD7310097.1 hypothetical protein [Eubacteriales bacterium]
MTEVTPQPLKTQGFHNCLILLFYDHPAKVADAFCVFRFFCRLFCVGLHIRRRT